MNEAVAGPGLWSPLIARLRYRQAERLIPEAHRQGRILDLGCGSFPAFLAGTRFREKHGVDRRAASAPPPPGVTMKRADLGRESLPWSDGHFDVVTLLAVIEHLAPETVRSLLGEVRRVLRPGGLAILTVPSRQGDRLLSVLSRLRLASAEQHAEHQVLYDARRLRGLLLDVGFAPEDVAVGRFELGMNLWARAVRSGDA